MTRSGLLFDDSDLDLRFLTALVVGGSPEHRRDLNAKLGAQGIECREAEDGIDALKFCGDLGIDMIIVSDDSTLMSAQEFMSLINRGAFGADPPPTVLWSGSGQTVAEALRRGFVGRLSCSIDDTELTQTLAAAFPA